MYHCKTWQDKVWKHPPLTDIAHRHDYRSLCCFIRLGMAFLPSFTVSVAVEQVHVISVNAILHQIELSWWNIRSFLFSVSDSLPPWLWCRFAINHTWIFWGEEYNLSLELNCGGVGVSEAEINGLLGKCKNVWQEPLELFSKSNSTTFFPNVFCCKNWETYL